MKMYLVTKHMYTMFLSNKDKSDDLTAEAEEYLKEEERHRPRGGEPLFKLDIKEITSIDDVPEDWKGTNYLWGSDGDMTPLSFLNREEEARKKEYQEYLRLKAKFEPQKEKKEEVNPNPGYYDCDWFHKSKPIDSW